ncbi:cytosolic carboxypeptidase 2-like, partial [Paramuricea clavata]
MMAAMETQMQLKEDKIAQKKDVKKRIHSGKRFSYGKTVQFPDWRISNDYNRTTQLIVSYKEGKKVPKLREPRNLYTVASKYNHSINIPRWPADMKVLSERPEHLDSLPHEPEKFYNSDILGEIPDNLPALKKHEDGKVVYENTFGDSKFFDSSQNGGDGTEKSQSVSSSDTLCFESRFESGNLSKAIKIGPCDYQLWLRTDLYTEKYTQWYYFRVENTQPGKVYRFTIMNLMKSKSLYSCGMKPLMYSEQEAREKGIGWRRVGTNIKYYKNELKREDAKGEHSLYSLSWTVVFPRARDRCYFAHCYPYTYTDLQEYLSKLSKDPSRAQYCKQRTLTRTLAGNFVYLMTITSPSKCPLEAKRKRAVVLTARVHPGETNSSWMMKGLLDYLTSDTLDAKLLRDTFVFKVVPMLNPDGVIVGNYRCSLSGRDLNRNYKTNLKDAFPSVWHTREMIKRLSQEREITLYCDFHGHSRQQNVFIYGCEDRANLDQGFKERVFPMMMSKNCEDKFCFKRCKFKVQKSKSGTGRVVMWNLGISNSYTMEATFCGSTLGSRAGEHFTTADFESMGYHLCDTLLDYCDPDMSKYFSVLNEVEVYVKSLVLARMKEKGVAEPDMKPTDIDLEKDYMSSESSPSGSDSSISDGLPMHVIYSEKEASKKKKKRLKTRKERNKRRARNWDKQSKGKEPTKQLEGNEVLPAKNTRVRECSKDLPAEGGKNSRASSHQRNMKTPSSPIAHEACKAPTNPEQFTEVN